MKKEEIQNLLTEFGFSVTLNRGIERINRTHMMHTHLGGKELVDYVVDEKFGSIREIYAWNGYDLTMLEDTASFKNWLKANQK